MRPCQWCLCDQSALPPLPPLSVVLLVEVANGFLLTGRRAAVAELAEPTDATLLSGLGAARKPAIHAHKAVGKQPDRSADAAVASLPCTR